MSVSIQNPSPSNPILVGTVEEQDSDVVEKATAGGRAGKAVTQDRFAHQLRIMDLTLSSRPFRVMLCAMSSSISSWSVIYMGVS